MPALSRWFVRTALVYQALGFALGGLLLLHKASVVPAAVWLVLPLHIQWLFLGWTLQLVMGVAFWIMPRTEASRGRIRLAWLSYGLLNGGLLLSAMAYLSHVLGWGPPLAPLMPSAAVCLVGSVVAYAIHLWPRVKPVMVPPAPSVTRPATHPR